MPVDTIKGFPVLATFLIRSKSVFSKEAILYKSTSRLSRKSTELSSKGVLKGIKPLLLACKNISS